MLDEIFEEVQTAMSKAIEALQRDLAGIRTGRATITLLDGIRIEYYGQVTPLNQVATISVPEARLLMIKPWEKGVIPDIEKAIRADAALGLNPANDGTVIRLPIPELTEEQVTELREAFDAEAKGKPGLDNFRLVKEKIQGLEEGRMLVRNHFLSLDPYMRGRMSGVRSYAKPVEVGKVMTGATVGEVIESRHPEFEKGDIVVGRGEWQEYALLKGGECQKVDPSWPSPSLALGVLGMPGVTAYTGMKNIGKPVTGETVVVAAASGAVGAVVGQIAKIHGARSVGVAGSKEKCTYVREELGFDECLLHRAPDFSRNLRESCPDGIDIYFENVGGAVFETVLPLLNDFARIPVCGLISHYNDTQLPEGPNPTPKLMRDILVKRLNFRGFIVWDFAEQEEEALKSLAGWIREGKLKYREDFVDGLDQAPEAFMGLLQGNNFGKLIVRLD